MLFFFFIRDSERVFLLFFSWACYFSQKVFWFFFSTEKIDSASFQIIIAKFEILLNPRTNRSFRKLQRLFFETQKGLVMTLPLENAGFLRERLFILTNPFTSKSAKQPLNNSYSDNLLSSVWKSDANYSFFSQKKIEFHKAKSKKEIWNIFSLIFFSPSQIND